MLAPPLTPPEQGCFASMVAEYFLASCSAFLLPQAVCTVSSHLIPRPVPQAPCSSTRPPPVSAVVCLRLGLTGASTSLCACLALSCLPHTSFCAFLRASAAPFLSRVSTVRGLPQAQPPLLSLSSHVGSRFQPPSASSCSFVLHSYVETPPVLAVVSPAVGVQSMTCEDCPFADGS